MNENLNTNLEEGQTLILMVLLLMVIRLTQNLLHFNQQQTNMNPRMLMTLRQRFFPKK